jgi:hypothetical protein
MKEVDTEPRAVRYLLHDLSLEVSNAERSLDEELERVLRGLNWERTAELPGEPALTLSVCGNGSSHRIPAGAREILRRDDFRGFEQDGSFYLTDGATLLHIRSDEARAEVLLAPSFSSRDPDSRRQFWMFALVKLLQGAGVYSLHAAGLVAPDRTGVLLVGDSGSGKSTLTIGLIRRGWRYLSDDAVLLRRTTSGIEALALRRHFYVDAPAAERYAGLPLGDVVPDAGGGLRRRVGIEDAFASQRDAACVPRVLLFCKIVPRESSALVPVGAATALGRLLAQCVRQAFEREATADHLVLLRQLLRQTRFLDLEAGSDLHRQPALLEGLLAEASSAKVVS